MLLPQGLDANSGPKDRQFLLSSHPAPTCLRNQMNEASKVRKVQSMNVSGDFFLPP